MFSAEEDKLNKELDRLIDEFPINVQFSKLLSEAENRFSHVGPTTFKKIVTLLWEKKKWQASFRQGSVRWH
jgi:hypothetical protein